MAKIQAIRGMNDILPAQTGYWQKAEQVLQRILATYGYQEIRLPILEKTELFHRGIGEITDIVEKEMYTFRDRNEEFLTLRPEGTAGCVRAAIEHGMLYNQQQKLWYMGPMFRYERPQKGRYRQFHQVGVEAFGYSDSLIEAELILIGARLWRNLGLTEHIRLQLNSLGSPAARQQYRTALTDYCHQHYAQLDEDCQRRLTTNPLRILDSKNSEIQALLRQGPQLPDYLDEASRQHLVRLCDDLHTAGISFEINPGLVRGLDYYTGIVFEWITESLGAQGAVCAGGRYDGLVAQLGGASTSAVGFAIGMERLMILYEMVQQAAFIPQTDIYIVMVDGMATRMGLLLAEQLHDALPSAHIQLNMDGGNFKTQFKRANKSGARYALVIGEEECERKVVTCKDLRQDVPQRQFQVDDLIHYLRSVL